MNIFSLIFAIIAAACFALDGFGWHPRETTSPRRAWGLVSIGLFFFVLSWAFQLLIVTTDPIHF